MRNTQLVRVQFDSPDPKLAASIANAHAKAYIANMLDVRVDATKLATEWMGKRLEGLRQELLASEAKLQEYREKEQLVDVAGLRALPTQEINDLSSQLLEVRQTLAAAEIAYLQVKTGGRKDGKPARRSRHSCRRRHAPFPGSPGRLLSRRWPSWRNATGPHILK